MLYRLKQLTMMFGDLIALYLGLFLAVFERHSGSVMPGTFTQLAYYMTALFLFVAVPVMFISGLYDVSRVKNSRDFFLKIIISAGIWTLIGVAFFYLRPYSAVNPKTILVLTALNGFGLVALWRYFHNRFLSVSIWKNRVVFAGVTPEVVEVIKIIRAEPQRGYEVLGVVVSNELILPDELSSLPRSSTLSALTGQFPPGVSPNIIVVAAPLRKEEALVNELYKLIFSQITITNFAKFYEELLSRIPPFTFSEAWFLNNLDEQRKKIYDRARIIADYICALILGLFFIITYPLIAALIKFTSPGPVFFRQERVGRLGAKFYVYKYRTMKALSADGSAETEGPQFAAVKDARVTWIGRILRASRVDELPQFLNILKGQMSVIGPRPERPEFVEQLTAQMPFYTLRLLIKPGLTGWAQIQNAYYGTLEENLRKLEYDLYYIKNRGFLVDLAIILRTVNIILRMIGR